MITLHDAFFDEPPNRMTKPQAREAHRRMHLPYGIWVCADGREVLFNRSYKPIWQRPGDNWSSATPADPNEWVKWKKQSWFYDDATAPNWRAKKMGKSGLRCLAILSAFHDGLPIKKYIISGDRL